MKNILLFCGVVAIGLTSCTKKIDVPAEVHVKENQPVQNAFTRYVIQKGQQFADENVFAAIQCNELKFIVKFDSSAIYKTALPSNQVDINKLYGFSDNNAQHHQFSARFGWRWSNNALRLFAYVYNNGTMSFKELGTVSIGSENHCAIGVSPDKYTFTLNDKKEVMPRASTTANAMGYRLYPFFGGDEVAPQQISIWIKELR